MTYYIISLVIIFEKNFLSLPIALINHFVLDNLSIWYTRSYLSIVRNWFSFIILLKNVPACHLTTVLIPHYQYSIYWDSTFFYLDYLMESYNYQKPIEQNQFKIMFILERCDSSLKYKYYALKIFVTRPRYIIY